MDSQMLFEERRAAILVHGADNSVQVKPKDTAPKKETIAFEDLSVAAINARSISCVLKKLTQIPSLVLVNTEKMLPAIITLLDSLTSQCVTTSDFYNSYKFRAIRKCNPSRKKLGFGPILSPILLLLLLWTCTTMGSIVAPRSLSTTANIPVSEWNALYDLYNATKGPNWDWNSDPAAGIAWNFTNLEVNNPCVDQWQGINCSFTSPFQYYHVLQIDLSYYQLRGMLPDTLSQLTYMQNLDLNSNQLTGSIPESLGNLTNLLELNLNNNWLTGAIPASLRSLIQLQYLHLGTNLLTRSIPVSLGRLTKLQYLYLYSNQFTGAIPESLGGLMQLNYLDLHANNLTNCIPESLGNLTKLQYLYLNTNQLTGSIPAALGNLTQLLYLDLHSNNLLGCIPTSLGSLTNLQYLDLDTNQLISSIPASLGSLTQLQYLFIYNNELRGSIPESLGSLQELQLLYLDNNQLTGPIPESLGSLTKLQELDLQSNQITGSIPGSFGGLKELKYVYLNTNQITGFIPESVGNLPQLIHLDLNSNQLTGSIPESLGSANELQYLDLHANMLIGSISESFGNLLELQYFDLHNNKLTGSIPNSLGNLTQLQNFDLSSNQLTGSIPYSLGSIVELLYLSIGGNYLTGFIPSAVSKLTLLESLTLGTNMLSGTIPTLSSLPHLRMVLLQNNKLIGNVVGLLDPTTQHQVEMVTLNSNQLTGTLPEAIFELKLKSFSAINNCFEGPLPIAAICNNLNLTNFIVDGMSSASSCQNKLFGTTYTLKYDIGSSLPSCLFQLPNITTLHLSGNGFTGSIPSSIILSDTLTNLSLSHNKLTGSIPSQIQLKKWSSIDLSYNRLAGTLQPNFASNKSIDLDNNRMSGGIPTSFYSLRDISILGSNMFTCSYDESDLPKYDSGRQRYHCGSNSFNSIFFTWLGAISVATIVLGYFKWKYHVFDSAAILAGSNLYAILEFVRKLSLAAALYSIVVLLPVYSACSLVYGTQTYKYAYQISAVFLSGVVPFAVNWLLWIILVLTLAVTVKMIRLSQVRRVLQLTETLTIALNWWDVMFIFIPYLVVNCLVVVGANAAYVYVAVYKGGSLLLVTQTLLSVFKIVWGRWALPYLRAALTQQNKYGKVQVITEVVVNILNNIVIPCCVVAGVSPNCFYYALVSAPSVESVAVNAECANMDPNTNKCLEFAYTYIPASFHPPFAYNYQCSASLITYYAPAFVSMCIVSTVVTPLVQYICRWFHKNSTTYPYLHRLLGYVLPRLMKPIDLTASVSSKGFLNSNGLMTTLIGLLALILTFGVMFPPLCVALTVTVLASVYMFRVNVQRFVSSATEQQRNKVIELLQAECNSVESMQMLKYSVWVLVTVSCWFYTLFLFDTLGDSVGFEGAYWVLIVMPLMPLVLYVVYLVVCRYLINTRVDFSNNNSGEDCNSQQSAEVEMQTIGLVHNILVVGEDKDAGSDC